MQSEKEQQLGIPLRKLLRESTARRKSDAYSVSQKSVDIGVDWSGQLYRLASSCLYWRNQSLFNSRDIRFWWPLRQPEPRAALRSTPPHGNRSEVLTQPLRNRESAQYGLTRGAQKHEVQNKHATNA